MYMLGRRRTCSRPSRTWICSAVYATSAPRDAGLRERSGRGLRTAITGVLALPAWRTHGDQLGRTSGFEFYRILNTKKACEGLLTGVFWQGFRRRLPAQDRVLALALEVGVDLARGGHLVQAPDREVSGLVVEALGVGSGLGDDLLDRRREGVERRLALGLRRLDHDCLGHDQREVDGRRIEVPVEQGLGDVQGPNPVLADAVRARHHLAHARPVVRHLQVRVAALPRPGGGEHGPM